GVRSGAAARRAAGGLGGAGGRGAGARRRVQHSPAPACRGGCARAGPRGRAPAGGAAAPPRPHRGGKRRRPRGPQAAPRPRRVLIVEDNADARESLSLLLRLSGHAVETSENAMEGLEKLTAFAPDVMLVDVGLPGMDG